VFDPAKLEQNFRGARLFVYPSLAELGESFGLAPLEAMAHGCAVMVSNLACFSDFVRDGQTGFLFDHRSKNPAQALREKLESVIVDPTLLARVSEAGYRKSAEFSIDRVADQFLHDFGSLSSQSDGAGANR
jgi:glycosyltransferase involved in cell wall biosynthesis